MVKVLRTELIEVKTNKELSRLCHQTKNLYNRANFLIKEQRKTRGRIPSYFDLDRAIKGEECYKILPAHTAQHTLKLLTRNWKAYFQAMKGWKRHPKKFLSKPRSPHFKRPKAETVAIISNQQAKIVNGWLRLPKKVNFTFKTRLTAHNDLREVRIVPRGVGYTIEIVHFKFLPKPKKKLPPRKGAIDLGLTNLVTFVDNIGSQPIVIKDEGKGIKSVTQYYLKEVKRIQQQYAKQQRAHLKHKNKLIYGTKFLHLRRQWRWKTKDWVHKVSRFLVELWDDRGLHTIYIGYNPLWKQQLRLRKKTTQLFVIVPFDKLLTALKYKAEEKDIQVELVEESYTSKCSFLDNELPTKHSFYLGKRVKRGLFRSATGVLINADVNAAFNILLKGDPQALPPRSVGGVGGYVVYPLRVSLQEMIL
ncbi:MAG: transposase [Candidatus Heimdallarchaeota archaeon]|nr:IS200/IS605 family element transposase accessory protein TnpB [Candidatus Heimdallarchaeota archaeon]MCG3255861.1 transposase [Candidatus Heimdallarchaeota archaeon]MCK4610932.1 transposase [Candidatus Heimdallarchaeota archaeon]